MGEAQEEVGATSDVTKSNGSSVSSSHGLSSQTPSKNRSHVSVFYAIPSKNSRKRRRIRDRINNHSISTKLSVHDQTWPIDDTQSYDSHQRIYSQAEMREIMVAYNIGLMKHYRPGEEEAETRIGVSTKLKLFSYPWNITKTLTISDLNSSSRLLLPTSLVDRYIMPFLTAASRDKVWTNKGLRVMVWDCDTNSNHHLVFKKWLSSDSYVLIDNWNESFKQRRQLAIGDKIGMCWDSFYSRFNFCLLNRAANDDH